MRRKSLWVNIHRGQLHATLGLPDKLPAKFGRVFRSVPCYDGYTEEGAPKGHLSFCRSRGIALRPVEIGRFDIVVKPSPVPNGRKSSAHRVFVVCPVCGRLVPAGRIGQHGARKDHQP